MTGLPYADEDGRTLQSGICENDRHAFLRVTDGEAVAEVCVSKADLPRVSAGLWESAGLRAPVILERPDILALDMLPGLHFTVNGCVIEAERPGGNRQFTPAAVRRLAASLAILADEAEAEPDPAEVEQLAAVVRKLANGTQIDDLARAILRAGYKREAVGHE